MTKLYSPLQLANKTLKNRFMLAPLTNLQSHLDGTLSDEEYQWLVHRAKGGFGLVHTCAAQVSETGKGFAGQLGVYDDRHLPGLTRLADGIREQGALSIVQLHHAGMRTPAEYALGQPVAPSVVDKFNARELSNAEVWTELHRFVEAAERSKKAGFDGVEVHGAHGYLITQFLSPEINRRSDEFGGDLAGRSKFINEVIARIRASCGPDFIVGVRLSPTRFGVQVDEMLEVASQLCRDHDIDYLDVSLWDVKLKSSEGQHNGRLLIDCFAELDLSGVPLGVAGNIYSTADCEWCLAHGADFVLPGRAGIIHHDFPLRCQSPDFVSLAPPVSRAHLASEKLGPVFIDYMATWDGFVAD